MNSNGEALPENGVADHGHGEDSCDKKEEREGREREGGGLDKVAFGQWLSPDSFGQQCIVMLSSTLGPN